ncbi:MAG: hypothetical protein EOP02_06605 [Proteobacteria bacterium]|nr:MAG: hypothetical protein EOP02_06605 [Pseudomonadota bacterium]
MAIAGFLLHHLTGRFMSIAKLREVAQQPLPFNVSDQDEMDEIRVLIAAGLIVGLRLRFAVETYRNTFMMFQVLAVTPKGRHVLHLGWTA